MPARAAGGLIQWHDLRGHLHGFNFTKSLSQIVLMNRGPLSDKPPGSRRELPFDKRKGFNIDNRLTPGVKRVKMRRRVIAEIHLDDDAVKS